MSHFQWLPGMLLLQSFVCTKTHRRTLTALLFIPYSQQLSSTTHGQSFPHIHDSLLPQIIPIIADFRIPTYGCCYGPWCKDGRIATVPFVQQAFLV